MNGKKSQAFWSIWNVAESAILLIAGILCIIFKDNIDLAKWISVAVGAFVVLDGALRVVLYFQGAKSGEESQALVGGFEVTLGIVIALQYQNFLNIVVMFLYVLLMVIGGLILAMSILKIIKHKSTLFIPILQVVLGAIAFGIGLAICLIYNIGGESASSLVLVIVGTILALVGVTQCVLTIIQTKKAEKKFKEEEKKVIEQKETTEAVEIKPEEITEIKKEEN